MSVKIKNSEFVINIVEEVKRLPVRDLKEILDFVYFVKAKAVTEPSQSYFWTKMWQKMEGEAEEDKKAGKIIGNGSTKSLLKELHKRAR